MVFDRGNFRGLLLLPYRQGAAIFVGGVLCGNKARSDEHYRGKRGNGGKAQRAASRVWGIYHRPNGHPLPQTGRQCYRHCHVLSTTFGRLLIS